MAPATGWERPGHRFRRTPPAPPPPGNREPRASPRCARVVGLAWWSTGAQNSRSRDAARTYAELARRWALTFERITTDPEVLGGVPCIRGLRVPVATVVGMVADGMTPEEILADFPYLEHDDIADIAAALRYAAEAVRERELPLRPVR